MACDQHDAHYAAMLAEDPVIRKGLSVDSVEQAQEVLLRILRMNPATLVHDKRFLNAAQKVVARSMLEELTTTGTTAAFAHVTYPPTIQSVSDDVQRKHLEEAYVATLAKQWKKTKQVPDGVSLGSPDRVARRYLLERSIAHIKAGKPLPPLVQQVVEQYKRDVAGGYTAPRRARGRPENSVGGGQRYAPASRLQPVRTHAGDPVTRTMHGEQATVMTSKIRLASDGILRCITCGQFVKHDHPEDHICPVSVTASALHRHLTRRLKLPETALDLELLDSLLTGARNNTNLVDLQHPLSGHRIAVDLDGLALALESGYKPTLWKNRAMPVVMLPSGAVLPVHCADGLDVIDPNDPTMRQAFSDNDMARLASGARPLHNAPTATATMLRLPPTPVLVSAPGDPIQIIPPNGVPEVYGPERLNGSLFAKRETKQAWRDEPITIDVHGEPVGLQVRTGDVVDAMQSSYWSRARQRGWHAPPRSPHLMIGRGTVAAAGILLANPIVRNGSVIEVYSPDRAELLAAFDPTTGAAADLLRADTESPLTAPQMAAVLFHYLNDPNPPDNPALGRILAATRSDLNELRKAINVPQDQQSQAQRTAGLRTQAFRVSDAVHVAMEAIATHAEQQGHPLSFGGRTSTPRCADCGRWRGVAHQCPVTGADDYAERRNAMVVVTSAWNAVRAHMTSLDYGTMRGLEDVASNYPHILADIGFPKPTIALLAREDKTEKQVASVQNQVIAVLKKIDLASPAWDLIEDGIMAHQRQVMGARHRVPVIREQPVPTPIASLPTGTLPPDDGVAVSLRGSTAFDPNQSIWGTSPVPTGDPSRWGSARTQGLVAPPTEALQIRPSVAVFSIPRYAGTSTLLSDGTFEMYDEDGGLIATYNPRLRIHAARQNNKRDSEGSASQTILAYHYAHPTHPIAQAFRDDVDAYLTMIANDPSDPRASNARERAEDAMRILLTYEAQAAPIVADALLVPRRRCRACGQFMGATHSCRVQPERGQFVPTESDWIDVAPVTVQLTATPVPVPDNAATFARSPLQSYGLHRFMGHLYKKEGQPPVSVMDVHGKTFSLLLRSPAPTNPQLGQQDTWTTARRAGKRWTAKNPDAEGPVYRPQQVGYTAAEAAKLFVLGARVQRRDDGVVELIDANDALLAIYDPTKRIAAVPNGSQTLTPAQLAVIAGAYMLDPQNDIQAGIRPDLEHFMTMARVLGGKSQDSRMDAAWIAAAMAITDAVQDDLTTDNAFRKNGPPIQIGGAIQGQQCDHCGQFMGVGHRCPSMLFDELSQTPTPLEPNEAALAMLRTDPRFSTSQYADFPTLDAMVALGVPLDDPLADSILDAIATTAVGRDPESPAIVYLKQKLEAELFAPRYRTDNSWPRRNDGAPETLIQRLGRSHAHRPSLHESRLLHVANDAFANPDHPLHAVALEHYLPLFLEASKNTTRPLSFVPIHVVATYLNEHPELSERIGISQLNRSGVWNCGNCGRFRSHAEHVCPDGTQRLASYAPSPALQAFLGETLVSPTHSLNPVGDIAQIRAMLETSDLETILALASGMGGLRTDLIPGFAQNPVLAIKGASNDAVNAFLDSVSVQLYETNVRTLATDSDNPRRSLDIPAENGFSASIWFPTLSYRTADYPQHWRTALDEAEQKLRPLGDDPDIMRALLTARSRIDSSPPPSYQEYQQLQQAIIDAYEKRRKNKNAVPIAVVYKDFYQQQRIEQQRIRGIAGIADRDRPLTGIDYEVLKKTPPTPAIINAILAKQRTRQDLDYLVAVAAYASDTADGQQLLELVLTSPVVGELRFPRGEGTTPFDNQIVDRQFRSSGNGRIGGYYLTAMVPELHHKKWNDDTIRRVDLLAQNPTLREPDVMTLHRMASVRAAQEQRPEVQQKLLAIAQTLRAHPSVSGTGTTNCPDCGQFMSREKPHLHMCDMIRDTMAAQIARITEKTETADRPPADLMESVRHRLEVYTTDPVDPELFEEFVRTIPQIQSFDRLVFEWEKQKPQLSAKRQFHDQGLAALPENPTPNQIADGIALLPQPLTPHQIADAVQAFAKIPSKTRLHYWNSHDRANPPLPAEILVSSLPDIITMEQSLRPLLEDDQTLRDFLASDTSEFNGVSFFNAPHQQHEMAHAWMLAKDDPSPKNIAAFRAAIETEIAARGSTIPHNEDDKRFFARLSRDRDAIVGSYPADKRDQLDAELGQRLETYAHALGYTDNDRCPSCGRFVGEQVHYCPGKKDAHLRALRTLPNIILTGAEMPSNHRYTLSKMFPLIYRETGDEQADSERVREFEHKLRRNVLVLYPSAVPLDTLIQQAVQRSPSLSIPTVVLGKQQRDAISLLAQEKRLSVNHITDWYYAAGFGRMLQESLATNNGNLTPREAAFLATIAEEPIGLEKFTDSFFRSGRIQGDMTQIVQILLDGVEARIQRSSHSFGSEYGVQALIAFGNTIPPFVAPEALQSMRRRIRRILRNYEGGVENCSECGQFVSLPTRYLHLCRGKTGPRSLVEFSESLKKVIETHSTMNDNELRAALSTTFMPMLATEGATGQQLLAFFREQDVAKRRLDSPRMDEEEAQNVLREFVNWQRSKLNEHRSNLNFPDPELVVEQTEKGYAVIRDPRYPKKILMGGDPIEVPNVYPHVDAVPDVQRIVSYLPIDHPLRGSGTSPTTTSTDVLEQLTEADVNVDEFPDSLRWRSKVAVPWIPELLEDALRNPSRGPQPGVRGESEEIVVAAALQNAFLKTDDIREIERRMRSSLASHLHMVKATALETVLPSALKDRATPATLQDAVREQAAITDQFRQYMDILALHPNAPRRCHCGRFMSKDGGCDCPSPAPIDNPVGQDGMQMEQALRSKIWRSLFPEALNLEEPENASAARTLGLDPDASTERNLIGARFLRQRLTRPVAALLWDEPKTDGMAYEEAQSAQEAYIEQFQAVFARLEQQGWNPEQLCGVQSPPQKKRYAPKTPEAIAALPVGEQQTDRVLEELSQDEALGSPAIVQAIKDLQRAGHVISPPILLKMAHNERLTPDGVRWAQSVAFAITDDATRTNILDAVSVHPNAPSARCDQCGQFTSTEKGHVCPDNVHNATQEYRKRASASVPTYEPSDYRHLARVIAQRTTTPITAGALADFHRTSQVDPATLDPFTLLEALPRRAGDSPPPQPVFQAAPRSRKPKNGPSSTEQELQDMVAAAMISPASSQPKTWEEMGLPPDLQPAYPFGGIEPAVLDPNYILTETHRVALESIFKWIRLRQQGVLTDHGVILSGPPGTGKNTIARTVAAMMKLPYVEVTLTPETDIRELIGTRVLEPDGVGGTRTAFRLSPLGACLLAGGVVAFNEPGLLRPGAMSALQRILEGYLPTEGGGNASTTEIPIHRDSIVVGTNNPGQSTGRNYLDGPAVDRSLSLSVPPPTNAQLAALYQERLGAFAPPLSTIQNVVTAIKTINDLIESGELQQNGGRSPLLIEMRATHRMLAMCADDNGILNKGLLKRLVLEYINAADPNEIEKVQQVLGLHGLV